MKKLPVLCNKVHFCEMFIVFSDVIGDNDLLVVNTYKELQNCLVSLDIALCTLKCYNMPCQLET